MKYKVGDKVRIKSLDWYNENKNEFGDVKCSLNCSLTKSMSIHCGFIQTIESVVDGGMYWMKESPFNWADEMIEGLVEEENNDCEKCGLIRNSTRCLFMDNCPHNKQKNIIEIPEDYVIKDENGNVINATKIVLEKKKKEYPKTYEECCEVLRKTKAYQSVSGYKTELLEGFQKLLICRDAYWKLYGEEMGLEKPWSPTDSDYITGRYCIFVNRGNIICDTPAQDCILTFPTAEMRDAFYENFKKEIEICKELL